MHLALFSPLSPLQTAIADHVEGLLPYMAEYADIDLFVDDGYAPSNPRIVGSFTIHNHRQLAELASQYDMIIYHMGDEPHFHGYIYRALQRHRGLVVLHDLVLHHCIAGLTLGKGDIDAYVAEMRYAYGEDGTRVASEIMSGRRSDLMHKYPLVERVVDEAQALVLHNDYARHQALRRRPKVPAVTIGQHFYLPDGVSAEADVTDLREQLDLQDRFVVATFGLLIPAKQLDVSLRAFARFSRAHPRAVYLLAGPVAGNFDLRGMIQRLGLEGSVRLVSWQEPPSFMRHMLLADLALQLRHPHIGGTPYTPIRLMGLGIPTIVTNIEPLAEIPEGCCAKIDVDEHEEDVLLATMEYLADHEETRREMAERGRSYIQTVHDPRTIAGKYKAFIEELLASATEPVQEPPSDWEHYLIEQAASVLSEWGVRGQDDQLLRPIAEAIASLDLGPRSPGDTP